jgi:type I restriction enzyme, S subunit
MEEVMDKIQVQKYPVYKDSGLKWLGKIPQHWSISKGKWLFIKEERPVSANDEIVTCFRDGEVTLRSNRKTEGFTNALKEHGYQGIRKGDLVIHNMDAFAGAIGISDSHGKSTPVYSVCTPRGNKTAYPFFYAYLLRALAKNGFIESLAKGIRERSTDFRFNDFGELLVSVPPYEEQKAIAAFLDRKTVQMDKAIAQKERLIELLKERQQMLIHKAVTRGLVPNVEMKDSGVEWIGEIPEHWKTLKAKYLFVRKQRPVKKRDEIVTCFRDGQVTLRLNRKTEGFTTALKEHGYQGIKKGDLVIHAMDAFAGAIGVSDSNGKSSPVYSVCTPIKPADVDCYYYAYFLREIARRGFIQSLAKGIRERSTDFRFADFAVLALPIPPKQEQAEIVAKIKSVSDKISFAITHKQKEIMCLIEYKAVLIDAVVTGKIKVS